MRNSATSQEQQGFVSGFDRGATSVEYAIMIGLIAAVIVTAVAALGGGVTGLFNTVKW